MQNATRITTMDPITKAITVGLNSLTAGVESKETVKRDILHACISHPAKRAEELPLSTFELLYKLFGLSTTVRGGKVVGFSMADATISQGGNAL